jgi:phosphohistidine phosphatase
MNLYFLRHAKAHARGPKFRTDSKRPLTRDGEEKMRAIARGMKKLGLTFDLILTSPYARALRTAEILAEVYRSKKLFATNHLAAEASSSEVIQEINDNFVSLENIALVGHEPYLTGLISVLLTGSPDTAIDLKKAGLCLLCVKDLRYGKCAALEWLLKPGHLAALG